MGDVKALFLFTISFYVYVCMYVFMCVCVCVTRRHHFDDVHPCFYSYSNANSSIYKIRCCKIRSVPLFTVLRYMLCRFILM